MAGIFALPAQEVFEHVDWYGLRSIDAETAAKALGFGPGASVDVDRDAAEARLCELPGVEAARIILMLAPGRAVALVGVREAGSATLRCRPAPDGDARVPAEFVEAYRAMLEASYDGLTRGQAGEDHDDGHVLSRYEPARKQQLRALALADEHREALRSALRESAEPEHRRVAAWAVAYVSDKEAIVPDLAFAMRDPDATVRNNAVRALSVLAEWARVRDDFRLDFDRTPLLEMLESLEWTDRNKSAALLATLASRDDVALLRQLQRDSLPALGEMARWSSLGHAGFSVRILAAIAGQDPREVYAAISSTPGAEARTRQLDELVEAARSRRWEDPA